jgi:hypothetical protein
MPAAGASAQALSTGRGNFRKLNVSVSIAAAAVQLVALVLATLVSRITIAGVTIFLHRSQAHQPICTLRWRCSSALGCG